MEQTVYVVRDGNGDIVGVFVSNEGDMSMREYIALTARVMKVGHYLETFSGSPVEDISKFITQIEKEVNGG